MTDHPEVIPRDSTERLFACCAPGIATLTTIECSGYDTISDRPQYLETLRSAL